MGQNRSKEPNLDLVCKSISDDKFSELCKQHHQYLKSLNVSYNHLTFQSMTAFSKYSWKNLTNLSLCSNKIGDKGCKYLTIAHIIHLQSLLLESNKISNTGAKHLSKANWIELTTFKMDNNHIKVQGIRFIIKNKWKKIDQLLIVQNTPNFLLLEEILVIVAYLHPKLALTQMQKNNVVLKYLRYIKHKTRQELQINRIDRLMLVNYNGWK